MRTKKTFLYGAIIAGAVFSASFAAEPAQQTNTSNVQMRTETFQQRVQKGKTKYEDLGFGFVMIPTIDFSNGAFKNMSALSGFTFRGTDNTLPYLYLVLNYFSAGGVINGWPYYSIWWGDPTNNWYQFKFEATDILIEWHMIQGAFQPVLGYGMTTMHLIGNDQNRITASNNFRLVYGMDIKFGPLVLQVRSSSFDASFGEAKWNGVDGGFVSPIIMPCTMTTIGITYAFKIYHN